MRLPHYDLTNENVYIENLKSINVLSFSPFICVLQGNETQARFTKQKRKTWKCWKLFIKKREAF